MKRPTPIKWIEVAEARVVCALATMEPGSVKISQSSDPGATTRRLRLLKVLWRKYSVGPSASDGVENRPQ
jgi:hypothetical protein